MCAFFLIVFIIFFFILVNSRTVRTQLSRPFNPHYIDINYNITCGDIVAIALFSYDDYDSVMDDYKKVKAINTMKHTFVIENDEEIYSMKYFKWSSKRQCWIGCKSEYEANKRFEKLLKKPGWKKCPDKEK